MSKSFLLFIILFISFGSQADDSGNLFDLSLDELMKVKVTIASLSEQTTASSPSSVTVYTREEMRQMGITSLEDLLPFVPGVQVSRIQLETAWDTGIIRGRGGVHGTAPSVLLMLDGRRMNNHFHGGPFDNPLNNLDWVKQVEIIRGPGSALYGANAFMGVINLVTEIKDNELAVRIGEPDLHDISLQYRKTLGDFELELYLQNYQDSGEEYDAFFNFLGTLEDTQDPLERDTAAVNLRYQGMYYKGYYTDSTADDYVIGSTTGNGVGSYRSVYESSRIGYDGFSGDGWSVDLHYDYFELTTTLFLNILPIELANLWWTDGTTDVTVLGGNWRRQEYHQYALNGFYKVNSDHKLTFGAEYREEKIDDNPYHGNWDPELMASSNGSVVVPCDCVSRGFYFNGELVNFINATNRYVENIYLQDEWQINDWISSTIGIRRDKYDDFGSNTSTRASLLFTPDDSSNYKIIYGEAFRAPSFGEAKARFASQFISNPDLMPELIKTLDLVWQTQWKTTNLSLTYSQSKIEDEIRHLPQEDVEFVQGITPIQPLNRGTTDLESVELELMGVVNDHWRYRFGYTHYFESTDLGVADDLLYFVINYQVKDFNVNLNGYYNDSVLSRKADGTTFTQNQYIDDFWRVNINANYKMNNDLTLYMRVENIFDEKNLSYARGINLDKGIPNRGRMFSAGMYWNF